MLLFSRYPSYSLGSVRMIKTAKGTACFALSIALGFFANAIRIHIQQSDNELVKERDAQQKTLSSLVILVAVTIASFGAVFGGVYFCGQGLRDVPHEEPLESSEEDGFALRIRG